MMRLVRRPAWHARLAAFLSLLGATLFAPAAGARTILSADGPGGTYDLIRQWYSIEVPDCKHMVEHIAEDFDADLQKNVFLFQLHVNLDDDRCMAQDRQRTEIRAKTSDVTALNGETVYYRWKFKLPVGFQETEFFTHIHQIKSDQADPILTLTPMSGEMFIGGRIGRHGNTDLAKFLGVWVVVESKVLYSNNGSIAMTIRRLSDGQVMLSYSGAADMWDDSSGTHDAKFGLYRSLDAKSKMRDETIRFADICVSKVSASECDDGLLPPIDAGTGDTGGAPDAATQVDASVDATSAGGAGGQGGSTATTATSATTTTGASGGASASGGAGGSIGSGGDDGHGGAMMPMPPGGSAGSRSAGSGRELTGGCACRVGARGAGWEGIALAATLVGTFARRRRRSAP